MRKSIISSTILIITLGLYAVTASADIKDTPHISVTGTAELKVAPDMMNWNLTVTTKDPSASNVGKRHERNVSEVLSFLEKSNIPAKDIQTSNIQLSENWVYRSKSNVMEGYIASTTISFKSMDFTQYQHLWIALSGFETVKIGGIYFDTSERIEHQNTARLKAAIAAKQKADALCEALGSKLQEALIIEEDLGVNEGYGRVQPMRNMVMSAAPSSESGGAAIAPGQISIHSRVNVTFRIMQN